ncbi:hypothetical protein KBD08_00570 [Candidatus Babeliales bacterium]|nr:hypothetical protein [Candidatus Babeliales bacterium]
MRSLIFIVMINLNCYGAPPQQKTIAATSIKTHPETTFDEVNTHIKTITAEIIAQGDVYKANKPRTTQYKTALKLASKQLKENQKNITPATLENEPD